jgi:hypothetical protein
MGGSHGREHNAAAAICEPGRPARPGEPSAPRARTRLMHPRRDILRWAAASLVGAALARSRSVLAQPARPPVRRGPRYFLSIYLSGGVDPVYTTDPRLRPDVEPWVDVPYGRDEIIDAGALRLGPHFAPLKPVAGGMAILNGVQVHTANHNTGSEQFLRMKTGTRPEMPSLLQLLGEHRDGQAVGCMDWLFGAAQFSRLFGDTPPDDLRLLSRVLRARAKNVLGDGSRPERRVTAGSLDETAELFERVAGLPRLRPERWSDDDALQSLAVSLQRILWIFEHDLARGVELNVGGIEQPWDTHTFNAERQKSASAPVAMIARFLGELTRRRSPRGPLSGETLVIMGSEIGRFPALNTAGGKDHFPEAPYVLFGAGVNAGGGKGAAYGRTGKNMAASPVALRTGLPAASGGHMVALDDVGATLLYLGGVADPTVYGYDGRVLEFLVDA